MKSHIKISKSRIAILLAFIYTPYLSAQEEELQDLKFIIKLNTSTLAGVVNPAVEFRIFRKGSIQFEGWNIYTPRNF